MDQDFNTNISAVSLDYQDPESREYPLLVTLYVILSNYLWIVPVLIGVPGNVLSIFVANRKHNRALSPCIYMKAMAVADTMVLIENAVGHTLVFSDLGKRWVVYMREVLFK
jgi:hypothetical protein